MKRLVSFLLIVALLASASAVGKTLDDSNAIFDCVTSTTGALPFGDLEWPTKTVGHAQFIIYPTLIGAGPCGSDVVLKKFWHPEFESWSLAEQWGILGQIIDYARSNASDLLADGSLLTDAQYLDANIIIAILTADDVFVYAKYFPITDQIEMEISDVSN
jgi:hypothetical protein